MEGGGREKQCLKPIQDKRSRRVTYARRNRGLKKKIQELATLCDVEACFVSLGSEGQVETWPAEESKVHETIKRYRSHPKANREKNMVFGISTSGQETKELEEEVQVLLDGSSWTGDEQEISNCHHEPQLLDELSNIELAKLDEFLGIKMKKIQDSIDAIIKSNSNHKNERRNIGSIHNYTANGQVQQQQRLPFFYITNKIDQQTSHALPVTGKPTLHNFLA